MTFGEKLVRLRRREGLSQEALAEALGVSRQAVSRWEQGTALPDAAKLLPCARLFSVSTDWLLDEAQGWEDQAEQASAEAPASGDGKWYLAGGITAGVGVLGMVVMGILSSVYPARMVEAPVGAEWVRAYTGLVGFLKVHSVEWLFTLWAAAALAGLGLLAQPALRRRGRGSVEVPCRYAAGIAAGLYGCGQAAWWVQLGKRGELVLMALLLAAALYYAVRLLLVLGREPEERIRRRERLLAALYLAAQGVALLLTAEAGIGLVGLVLHVGIYFLCAGVLSGGAAGPRR